MKLFLLLLLAFFHFGVDDPPPPDADQNPNPDSELDADPEDPAPDAEPDPKLASSEELEAERRGRTAEKERADRFEREAADLRARHAPRQDDESAREDAILKDPASTDLQKWQVTANRQLRAGSSAAQTALMQAEDVRDQTAFSRLAMSEPALHKRYEAKVEEELGNARKQGYNPKREFIYNQLIAKDMREGKFKKKAAPAADDAKGRTVNRGKLPGVKSDVGGRGGLSEHEKRRARLENVQI